MHERLAGAFRRTGRVVAVAAISLGVALTPLPARASPAVPNAPGGSVVGLYSMFVTVSGTQTQYWLQVRSDSSWIFLGPQLIEGTWSQSGTTFNFDQFWPDRCAIFSGTLTSTGLNSSSSPGSFSGCSGPGTWYALRPAVPTATVIVSTYPHPVVAGWLTVDVNVFATAPISPLPVLTGMVTISNGTTACQATLASGAPGDGFGGCSILMGRTGVSGLTASYSGDGDFLASQAAAPTVVKVTAAASRTVLQVKAPTVKYGSEQTDPFTVSVVAQTGLPVTGRVTIVRGSAQLCTATLAGGSAKCLLTPKQLPPGTFWLRAMWPGNGATTGSTSGPVRLVVR